jgi:hypothetical protein
MTIYKSCAHITHISVTFHTFHTHIDYQIIFATQKKNFIFLCRSAEMTFRIIKRQNNIYKKKIITPLE